MAIITDLMARQATWLRGILKRENRRRYDALCGQILDHRDTPRHYLDDDQALRSVVCVHTGLQPSEWDQLGSLERLPYAEQAIAALEVAGPDIVATSGNDDRDKWIYEQLKAGKVRAVIIDDLQSKRGWDNIATEQGIGLAADRYAHRQSLPRIRRKKQ